MTLTEILSGLELEIIPLFALGLVALVFSSFVKISTVLAILRSGLGFHSLPSSFVTGSLAITLSFFVMYPHLRDAASAIDKVVEGSSVVSTSVKVQAIGAAGKEWKEFLLKHSDPELIKELALIANKIDQDSTAVGNDTAELSRETRDWRVLAPAFYLSELREAFSIGLKLFLPFLVIDLCVAHLLVALGVTRLEPSSVALPAKLLLFVALDGWSMIAGNLLSSYAA